MQIPKHTALLLITALLAACGSTVQTNPTSLSAQGKTSTTTTTVALPKDYKYLHHLTIPATVTREELAKLYSGYVVEYNPEFNEAVVANNSTRLLTYDSAPVEANAVKYNTGVGAQGYSMWAGGYSLWAGGYSLWAGGTTTSTSFTENQPIWDAIGLSNTQTLVPELGKGVKVAVIDTGVDMKHPGLSSKLDTTFARDFLDGDTTPQEVNLKTDGTYSPGFGHGTAVAGIILQIAPNATILPIRVLNPDGGGDTATVAAAIDHAVASGAKVINLSLGGVSKSDTINKAIGAAVSKGVAVVTSSGNTGDTNVTYPAVDAAHLNSSIGLGAAGVGSVGTTFLKSSFSTYGSNLEMTSIGENIKTLFPGEQTVGASGTSFAAPTVSGALALAISTGLNNTSGSSVQTMLSNLTSTATANTDPTFGSQLGKGTLNVFRFVDIYR